MVNILILGAGRSGTSMVAGLFRNSGTYQGARPVVPTESNPRGYYEDIDVNGLNDDIIESLIAASPLTRLRNLLRWKSRWSRQTYWLYSPRRAVLPAPTGALATRIQKQLAVRPFCYKDPRFSLTLPAWVPFLPHDTVFLVVFRAPALTVASTMRDVTTVYQPALDIPPRHVWRAYIHTYERLLAWADSERWLFVHYDTVLDGSALGTIRGFTGLGIDASELDPALNRSRGGHHRGLLANWHAERTFRRLLARAASDRMRLAGAAEHACEQGSNCP